MSQLKNFFIMLMYVYILIFAINSNNVIAAITTVLLGISYIKIHSKLCMFNINMKNNLSHQREFLVNSLSHDLRIPTIAQIRALELIKNESFGKINNQQKEMLNQIEDSCKCILNLLSLMINSYNLENNTYKLIYERFNLSDVILSCFNELSEKASEKQITFEYNNKFSNLCITADKSELRKVIMNILQNSIINTNSGEKLSVITTSCNKKIRLTFVCGENNHLYYSGICDESAFSSVGQSIIMHFCKKIIENHKGKILKNNCKNTFSFELPQYVL